jgi:hypothetical protein
MSNNFALEMESIISRLHPLRLELLEAAQHFPRLFDQRYGPDGRSQKAPRRCNRS